MQNECYAQIVPNVSIKLEQIHKSKICYSETCIVLDAYCQANEKIE